MRFDPVTHFIPAVSLTCWYVWMETEETSAALRAFTLMNISDVNKNYSRHHFSVPFVWAASARPPCYCNFIILLCDVFINQSCVCRVIGIYWFQIQTFCSQALNSLLTTEYLVECVTGKGRRCQDVCVV